MANTPEKLRGIVQAMVAGEATGMLPPYAHPYMIGVVPVGYEQAGQAVPGLVSLPATSQSQTDFLIDKITNNVLFILNVQQHEKELGENISVMSKYDDKKQEAKASSNIGTSSEFGVYAQLRQLGSEMDQVIIEAEVSIENTKLFLASREAKNPRP